LKTLDIVPNKIEKLSVSEEHDLTLSMQYRLKDYAYEYQVLADEFNEREPHCAELYQQLKEVSPAVGGNWRYSGLPN
jgi:hypothetical protein